MSQVTDWAAKNVLVTGASSGIGQATADHFHSLGAHVLGADRAGSSDRPYPVVSVDVRDADAVGSAIEQLAADGTIDVCVANAGIIKYEGWLDSSLETWRSTLDVNLLGTFNTLQLAARRMVADQTSGRLLVTSSVGGLRSNPGFAAYCASKAALISLVEGSALALAPYGITVNAVAPGEISTRMHDEVMVRLGEEQGKTSAECRAEAVATVPLGRMGDAVEVAKCFEFLASDNAAYLTGLTVRVDGGQLLH